MSASAPWLLPTLLVAAIAFGAWLFWQIPKLSAERGGRIVLFIVLFALPLLMLRLGVARTLEDSKERQFCNSCHEMNAYEQSLFYEDSEFVPANHFQKRLVPAETACYACHTDYTMYGDVKAKMNGLVHVLVHFMGDVPAQGEIELYDPYPNDNCLKCHGGSRSFEGVAQHDSEDVKLDELYANTKSCSAKGCHDLAHAMNEIDDLDLWRPEGRGPAFLAPFITLPPPKPPGAEDEEDDLWGDDEEEEDEPADDEAAADDEDEAPADDEAAADDDDEAPAEDKAAADEEEEAPADDEEGTP